MANGLLGLIKYRGHRVIPDNLMKNIEEAKSS